MYIRYVDRYPYFVDKIQNLSCYIFLLGNVYESRLQNSISYKLNWVIISTIKLHNEKR